MNSVAGLFPKRNVFDLSHERKLSCEMASLVPIMCEEVLPGDTFKVNTDALVRVAPLLAPIMHRVHVYTHFFFVPNRLVWDDFQNFITGGETGADASVAPTITATHAVGSLADYFGLPTGVAITHSALPFRAYNMIYNEWYRDQNLQTTPVALVKTSGADATTSVAILTRNWEKDYFTSSLPYPQKGTAVTVPLLGTATVTIPGTHPTSGSAQLTTGTWETGTLKKARATGGGTALNMSASVTSAADIKLAGASSSNDALQGSADLSTATGATINSLRLAFQVQKFMERSMRAGSRYIESILAHFGVQSSDARLQRPEYLGGGKSNLVISEVLQSSATTITDSDTPLGTMAGHGFSAMKSHSFSKSFEEHGYIIGIMSILPRTAYQQGLPRTWTRATKFDYYWPELANIGEQAVLRKEVYADGTGTDNNVWGYQGRYDEYRRRENIVCGDFKTTLSHWHLGRIFGSAPTLNSSFITANPDTRIFAVAGGQHFWVQLINNVTAIRPIPKTGEPGFIDHN